MQWIPLNKQKPPEGKTLLVRCEEQQIGLGWYKNGELHFKEDVSPEKYWSWSLVTEHDDKPIDHPW